jgi:hypothetical protein
VNNFVEKASNLARGLATGSHLTTSRGIVSPPGLPTREHGVDFLGAVGSFTVEPPGQQTHRPGGQELCGGQAIRPGPARRTCSPPKASSNAYQSRDVNPATSFEGNTASHLRSGRQARRVLVVPSPPLIRGRLRIAFG